MGMTKNIVVSIQGPAQAKVPVKGVKQELTNDNHGHHDFFLASQHPSISLGSIQIS